MDWTFKGNAYCQLIHAVNKEKYLVWTRKCLDEVEDGFMDVIWSDEFSIQWRPINAIARTTSKKQAPVRINV